MWNLHFNLRLHGSKESRDEINSNQKEVVDVDNYDDDEPPPLDEDALLVQPGPALDREEVEAPQDFAEVRGPAIAGKGMSI